MVSKPRKSYDLRGFLLLPDKVNIIKIEWETNKNVIKKEK